MVRRTVANGVSAISPAVGSVRFLAAFELVQGWIPWCGAIVVAVRIRLGVAAAQHAEAKAKGTRVSVVGVVDPIGRVASVTRSLLLMVGRRRSSIVRGSGVTVDDLCVVRKGDALALSRTRVGRRRSDGAQAVGVQVVGRTTMQFELAGLACEFSTTRIGRLEILWIVEVLVVDADDAGIARIHGESYAGLGFAHPGVASHVGLGGRMSPLAKRCE